MAIPGIKVTQSAIESYKASRAALTLPAAKAVNSEEITNSVAFVRKPIKNKMKDNAFDKASIEYAVAHGTPENVAKNLDTIG